MKNIKMLTLYMKFMYHFHTFRKKQRNCGLEETSLEEGACVGIFPNHQQTHSF